MHKEREGRNSKRGTGPTDHRRKRGGLTAFQQRLCRQAQGHVQWRGGMSGGTGAEPTGGDTGWGTPRIRVIQRGFSSCTGKMGSPLVKVWADASVRFLTKTTLWSTFAK